MSETFHILYPDNRVVSADKILGWFNDACENGEIDGVENPQGANPHFAAKMLDQAGLITLARGR